MMFMGAAAHTFFLLVKIQHPSSTPLLLKKKEAAAPLFFLSKFGFKFHQGGNDQKYQISGIPCSGKEVIE